MIGSTRFFVGTAGTGHALIFGTVLNFSGFGTFSLIIVVARPTGVRFVFLAELSSHVSFPLPMRPFKLLSSGTDHIGGCAEPHARSLAVMDRVSRGRRRRALGHCTARHNSWRT